MAIPDLDENGLLPPGIHECDFEELKDRFGKFQQSDRRPTLCAKLGAFLEEARSSGLIAAVVVDGSFVTSKSDPGDIDLVVVLAAGHDFQATLRPADYNLLSKKRVKAIHGFDVFIARAGSPEFQEYTGFFRQVRGLPTGSKGILMVSL
jgi:hypothetical protein